MTYLKRGSYLFMVTNTNNKLIAVPTTSKYANGRVLKHDHTGLYAHWKTNYNLDGDFSSEVMKFELETLGNKPKYQEHRYILDYDYADLQDEVRTLSGLIPANYQRPTTN